MGNLEERRWCTESEFLALYDSRIMPNNIERFMVCKLALLVEHSPYPDFPGAIFPCYISEYMPNNRTLTLGIFALAGESSDTLLERKLQPDGELVLKPVPLRIHGKDAVTACLAEQDFGFDDWAQKLQETTPIYA